MPHEKKEIGRKSVKTHLAIKKSVVDQLADDELTKRFPTLSAERGTLDRAYTHGHDKWYVAGSRSIKSVRAEISDTCDEDGGISGDSWAYSMSCRRHNSIPKRELPVPPSAPQRPEHGPGRMKRVEKDIKTLDSAKLLHDWLKKHRRTPVGRSPT